MKNEKHINGCIKNSEIELRVTSPVDSKRVVEENLSVMQHHSLSFMKLSTKMSMILGILSTDLVTPQTRTCMTQAFMPDFLSGLESHSPRENSSPCKVGCGDDFFEVYSKSLNFSRQGFFGFWRKGSVARQP